MKRKMASRGFVYGGKTGKGKKKVGGGGDQGSTRELGEGGGVKRMMGENKRGIDWGRRGRGVNRDLQIPVFGGKTYQGGG